MTLDMLNPGEGAVVKEIITEGGMRRRLLDIGLVEGARVDCIGRSPGGRPVCVSDMRRGDSDKVKGLQRRVDTSERRRGQMIWE